jgi:hypothetical protein
MIQTEQKPAAVTKPRTKKIQPRREFIPFDTSVKRALEESYATLNLMGTFTGERPDLNAVEFAFLSKVIESVSIVRLKVSETFYANGQKAYLAKIIAAHAAKKGKKIVFDNFTHWEDVHHIFHKN